MDWASPGWTEQPHVPQDPGGALQSVGSGQQLLLCLPGLHQAEALGWSICLCLEYVGDGSVHSCGSYITFVARKSTQWNSCSELPFRLIHFLSVDYTGKWDKLDSLISHLGLGTELGSVNIAPKGQNLKGGPEEQCCSVLQSHTRHPGHDWKLHIHYTGNIWASGLTPTAAGAQAGNSQVLGHPGPCESYHQ